jgi:hypothetical protein
MRQGVIGLAAVAARAPRRPKLACARPEPPPRPPHRVHHQSQLPGVRKVKCVRAAVSRRQEDAKTGVAVVPAHDALVGVGGRVVPGRLPRCACEAQVGAITL